LRDAKRCPSRLTRRSDRLRRASRAPIPAFAAAADGACAPIVKRLSVLDIDIAAENRREDIPRGQSAYMRTLQRASGASAKTVAPATRDRGACVA